MELQLTDVYIERCDKETEELLSNEEITFLDSPLNFLKQNQNEFLYIESPTFNDIRMDAISLELDDVFKTYTALFGFKVQKKHNATIKTFLEENLNPSEFKNYSAMFSGEDGLWELNIPIDCIEGFQNEMTIKEAISITYHFIQSLLKIIEQD